MKKDLNQFLDESLFDVRLTAVQTLKLKVFLSYSHVGHLRSSYFSKLFFMLLVLAMSFLERKIRNIIETGND